MFSMQTVQAKENIPTLFVHGWGSSYRAEEHMVKAALKAKVTKTVVRIDVDVYGQAHLVGNLPKILRIRSLRSILKITRMSMR